MKKEEFPTFLNEQPTIIFGRTGRELLIIVCGLFFGYRIWENIHKLLPDFIGTFLGILLASMIVIAFLVLALFKVGYRHLEEWIFAWFIFIAIPKIYLYKPWENEIEYQAEGEGSEHLQIKQVGERGQDDLDDDLDDD